MEQKDFYIGYNQDNKGFFKKPRKVVFLAALGALLFVGAFVFFVRPFSAGVFEFGKKTELEGYLLTESVPMLVVEEADVAKHIVLVAFGKFGAEKVIEQAEAEHDADLHLRRVRVRGTLIKGVEKTLLELTDNAQSIIEVTDQRYDPPLPPNPKSITIKGEIIDPKCFFGVMKPGRGKPHKSCAVRCISGGIPPVLLAEYDDGSAEHYLLLDTAGKPINKEVLDYVAESVELTGRTVPLREWHILYIDPKKDIVNLN